MADGEEHETDNWLYIKGDAKNQLKMTHRIASLSENGMSLF